MTTTKNTTSVKRAIAKTKFNNARAKAKANASDAAKAALYAFYR